MKIFPQSWEQVHLIMYLCIVSFRRRSEQLIKRDWSKDSFTFIESANVTPHQLDSPPQSPNIGNPELRLNPIYARDSSQTMIYADLDCPENEYAQTDDHETACKV